VRNSSDLPVDWGGVDAEDEPHADWVATERRWTKGWRRFVLPAVFLVYLAYVAQSVGKNNGGGAAFAGYAILIAFALAYLLLIAGGPSGSSTRFWTLYGICFALFVAEVPFARAAAFVMCLYLAAMSVARLDTRAAPIVAAMAVAALVVPSVVSSWHQDLGDAWGTVTPVAIPVVAIVSLGVRQVFRSNQELAEARLELARLAAENERFRIARDLHDLLGHSLTTITVKAGLARQLGEADPARSKQEIAEVEDLARRSLADVRAAVANYRDVTLAGELATGRELLRAAGITAEVPRAADVVDPIHQELFGWVVREGLTNVVRHAHASSCSVRLSQSSVEIVDDGVGRNGGSGNGTHANAGAGNGLAGLRERVAAAGGVVDAGPLQPHGWRLRVSLAPEAAA
jgi:two-component system, NarL family, sensor histidine kinase DesK